MTDLKPCPFCGGDKVWIRQIDMGKFHYAECQGCLAITTYHDTKAEAITAWNTRADRWIPVTERLPEAYVDIWVTDGESVEPGYFTGYVFFVENQIWNKAATHWQPKPHPPAKREEVK